MFAIIKSGGKQYKVSSGETLKIEYQNYKKGQIINFEDVLFLSTKNNKALGKPTLKNVIVTAKVLEQVKEKKILVFKKRRRHNSRKLNGHRQLSTIVEVQDIIVDGKKLQSTKEKKANIEPIKDKKVNKNVKAKEKPKKIHTTNKSSTTKDPKVRKKKEK